MYDGFIFAGRQPQPQAREQRAFGLMETLMRAGVVSPRT